MSQRQARAPAAAPLRSLAALAALVVLAPFLAACGPSAEEREAAAVVRAADVLRDAPAEAAAEQRRALLADLERAPAASPPAVRARDACVRAYRLLLDGKDLEARVRAALEGGGTPGAAVLLDLTAAEAKIEESAAAMPDCEAALSDLRRRLRGP